MKNVKKQTTNKTKGKNKPIKRPTTAKTVSAKKNSQEVDKTSQKQNGGLDFSKSSKINAKNSKNKRKVTAITIYYK